ncbi:MAG: DUF1540 domain-containing protein [Defluviitaleaceae bacterium]|nr:DUF1540 domain-containing protein [Defluviitaleaceae bacterium]
MINCSVKGCNYNDQDNHCTLTDITVGCSTSTPHECCDTECDSFECS